MKKLLSTILLSSLSAFVFGQSISLNPASADELTVTTYGTSTNSSILGRKAGGSIASPTATPSGTVLLVLGARGHTGTAFNSASPAFISMVSSQTFSTTASGSYIRFGTTENNTTLQAERMRINHDGKIGINTTNPLALLHVTKGLSGVTPNASSAVFIDDNANNYLGLASTDATETGILFGKPTLGAASGGIIYTPTSDLNLRTGGNNTRMTITSSGNIGVGTTSPNTKFVIHESAVSTSTRLRLTNATTGSTTTDGAYIEAESGGELTIGNRENFDMDFVTNDVIQFTIKADGKVGIGSQSPTAKLHVEGDLALSKITTMTVNGGYNDHDRQGSSILRFTNGGTLNGIAGGADGMILYVFNTGLSSLIINHQNAGSLASNRIITHTNANVNLGTIGGVTMIYDGSSSRWRIVSIAQ